MLSLMLIGMIIYQVVCLHQIPLKPFHVTLRFLFNFKYWIEINTKPISAKSKRKIGKCFWVKFNFL